MNVLILDLETTGLDPEHHSVIEVGYVLWSAKARTLIEAYSTLLPAAEDGSGSEKVNGIPRDFVAVESEVGDPEVAWALVDAAAGRADVIVAHSAKFDRGFVEALPRQFENLLTHPWVCTIEDFIWPIECSARNLVQLALCHGVGVLAAHRAVDDCLTLARMFDRLPDVDERLVHAYKRACRPKAEFISLAPWEQKDIVKAHGFHWNGTVWHRYMAVADTAALPFGVVVADA